MNAPEVIHVSIPSLMRHLNVVGACVYALCARVDKLSNPDAIAWNIDLALTEATTNVIRHAYQGQTDQRIHFVFTLFSDEMVVDIFDYGKSFDASQVARPDLREPHEGGYGLLMMETLMDEFSYHAKGAAESNLAPGLADHIKPQQANHHRLVKRFCPYK